MNKNKVQDNNQEINEELNNNQEQMECSQENKNSSAQDESSETTVTETLSIEEELEKAQSTITELTDKYLRTVAEFENYKKRTLKEKTELILNGGEKTITTILPIIDDMERAIITTEAVDDAQAIKEGWNLIYKKLFSLLESQGVKKINTQDVDFDVDFHEAVAMVPGVEDNKKGKVIDCVQTGYTLNDKVIRHAKVAVGQ